MSYLAALLIISMVVAPVLWIMPSPKQKRQVAMRQKAMAMGLQVKICDLPQSHRQKVRAETPEQGVAYRLLFNHDSEPGRTFEHICIRQEQQGRGSENKTQENKRLMQLLLEQLAGLPEGVVALAYSNTGLAVYWREQGGLEQVENIYQVLLKLKSTLIQQRSELSEL